MTQAPAEITGPKRPAPPVGRRFQPGVSPNPGGMPKGVGEVRRLAREHAPEAVALLVKAMQSDDAGWSARITAAMALLDRGFGKPTQPLDIQDSRPLAGVPAEALLDALAKLRDAVGTGEVGG